MFQSGNSWTSLLFVGDGQPKVAPLKATSVPRLELQGETVRESHSKIEDSSGLIQRGFLAWIKSDHRIYRQFVATRVGKILSTAGAVE